MCSQSSDQVHPIQEKDKRSFEALAAIVYQPEKIQAVDRHHRQIMEKTCVISALDCPFRTLFRTSEAILGKPPVARGEGTLGRLLHAL